VGVALVASAAKTLIGGTCKDRVAMVINALAAVAVLLYPATWMFPLVIVLGKPPHASHMVVLSRDGHPCQHLLSAALC
jgi:hypothetical protein